MCPITSPFIFLHVSGYSHSQHNRDMGGVLDVSTAVKETACLLQSVI